MHAFMQAFPVLSPTHLHTHEHMTHTHTHYGDPNSPFTSVEIWTQIPHVVLSEPALCVTSDPWPVLLYTMMSVDRSVCVCVCVRDKDSGGSTVTLKQ